MRLIDADMVTEGKFHSIPLRQKDSDRDIAYMYGWNDALDAVSQNAPTVEPRPKGEWVKISPADIYECSNCHKKLVEKIKQLEELIEEKDAHINILEASIERFSELPPAYFCDPDKNTECRKTGCFKIGGQCKMTLKKSCAAYVDDRLPEPIRGGQKT